MLADQAAEPAEPWLIVAIVLMGAWGIYNGVQTWRGKEPPLIERYERDGIPRGWIYGGRRQYQTFLGAGLVGLPIGLGFVFIGVGVWVRDLFDKPSDWGPWYASAVIGTVLLGIGFLYSLAYFWTGVPDGLRPPSQRGQPPAGKRR